MLKELIKLANSLDVNGLKKEADFVDNLINKHAEEVSVINTSGVDFCDLPKGPWAINQLPPEQGGGYYLGPISRNQRDELKECSDAGGELIRAKNPEIGLYNIPPGDETGESWCFNHQSQVHCGPKEI